MIRIVINRKTGEEKITDIYSDPNDAPLELIADCLAKMILEHGLLNLYQQANDHQE